MVNEYVHIRTITITEIVYLIFCYMCNLFGPVKRFFGFYKKNSDTIGNTTHSNSVDKHEHTNFSACQNSDTIGNTTHSNCVGKHEHTNFSACKNSDTIGNTTHSNCVGNHKHTNFSACQNSDTIGNTTHSNCVGKHGHTNYYACQKCRPIHYHHHHGCRCLRFNDKKPDNVIKKPEFNNCNYCKQLYHIIEKLVDLIERLNKRTYFKKNNNKESSLNITKSNRSVLRFKEQEVEEIPVNLNPAQKPTAKNNLPLIIKPILKPSMQTNNEIKIEHINKNYSSDSISNKSVKGSIIDVIKKYNPKYTKEIHYKKDKIVLNSSKISKDELVGGQIVTNYDDYLAQIPENTKNKKKE